MAKKAIVGKKVGMTQIWADDNRVIPVTVLRVDPCRIVQVKTSMSDGYSALQVTFGHADVRKLSQPKAGHFAKASVAPGPKLVELRLDDVTEFSVGQELSADLWAVGDKIDVTSVSRGKGQTGVMQRHNFKGQGASHGAHLVHRAPGSIGQCATPGRVFKGQKMAGRDGGMKTTILNLEIVKSDVERGLILVKGAVPGPRGGVVVIRNAAKGA